jgi:chaperonin GroES
MMRRTVMTLKPLADRVLVKVMEAEEKTPGGILLPDTAKEKPQKGEVVAVGPGRIDNEGNRIPLELSKGQNIIFTRYGGTEVKFDNQEYKVLTERDILAVVE